MSTPRWNYGEELRRVECGVDFGGIVGYFVRMSVVRDDGGTEWISLNPDEAGLLAESLRESAALAREQEDRRRS
jgi:hypothetical protein